MFTFGCSPVLDLDNARLFAQQFPHHPLSSIAYNAFILLSGLMSLYKVTLEGTCGNVGFSPALCYDT